MEARTCILRVVRGGADARARVLAADTMWLGWQEESVLAARILPRLLSAVGKPQRALVASRRRHLALGFPSLRGLPRLC
jgi:hypothetical protein